jgi:hypothetical protein
MSAEPPPRTWERTHTCVVKRCLAGVLNDGLGVEGRRTFLDYIDQSTEMISRMTRRASMLFLYFVVRRLEDGLPVGAFNDGVKDAYWKQWLRAGLVEFGSEFPSEDVRPYFGEVQQWIGTTLGCGDPPEYFDRILGHAAIAFKTSVMNNQTAHFFAKTKRLCKGVAQLHLAGVRGASHLVFEALRHDEPDPAWPPPVLDIISSARKMLGLAAGDVLFEDTDIPMPVRLAYHWWMQQRLAELGLRKNKLSPVMQVARAHIRLDATTLYMLAWKCFSPKKPPSDEPRPTKCPNKTSHPVARERAAARAEWKRLQDRAEEAKAAAKTAYGAELAKFVSEHGPSYSALAKEAPDDPVKRLNKDLPPLSIGPCPKELKKDKPAWNALQATRRRARDARIDEREAVKNSDEFKAAKAAYEAYEERTHRVCLIFFRPLKNKSLGSGWKASGSICTDGVSVSIAYERVEQVPYAAEGESARKAAAAKAAKKAASDLPPKDDYDPEAPTIAGDRLILGVDPGRTQLVTVVCVDTKGKKHTWRLSRGQYYAESGIVSENKRQSRRYEPLAESFGCLPADGGSLRASTSLELKKYFKTYAEFEPQWWSVALKRCESRSRMRRFIGKQSAMARFVSKLRKDAEALLLEMVGQGVRRIDVAYGSAVLNMASTGRGEAAVPTSETFRAFQNEFRQGGHAVTSTWEHNTTAVSWNTGKRTESVFKRYDGPQNRERLCHCVAGKQPPLVSPTAPDRAATLAVVQTAAAKGKRRRGGASAASDYRWSPPVKDVEDEAKKKTTKKEELRYPACRGLRFCPERRMFYDRDESSAVAIAGLRRLELLGFGRPTAFRSNRANKQIDGSSSEGASSRMDAAGSMVAREEKCLGTVRDGG